MNLLTLLKREKGLFRYASVLIISLFAGGDLLRAANYEVGAQKPYTTIGSIPWGELHPGDSVLIFYRDTPYKEKWVICTKGAVGNPVVVSGIANAQGELPVIDGREAVTDSQFDYWNEERGLIKIGGANSPKDTMPEYIIVQNLEIRSARVGYTFTGRYGITNYFKNAAAVYIEKGEHITIRNCILHDCGNGLFTASKSKDVVVEGCYYFDNGIENSIYEHNNYTESQGITFQYNRFGPLRQSCLGNNLKDRSKGCVIRYNWIEGANRQLDLVHSKYSSFYTDTLYNKTFVYGNILIEPDNAGNSQICHYGGDNADSTHCYRKGTLYFYHNTIISTRTGNTTLVRLSTNDEKADIRNNIIYVTEAGSSLGIVDSDGTADLRHNWLKTGWKNSHSGNNADVNDSGGNIIGELPGFTNFTTQDFSLLHTSNCISGGTLLPEQCYQNLVLKEYVKHQKNQNRRQDAVPDIGAFEYAITAINHKMNSLHQGVNKAWASPNPFKLQTNICFSSYNGNDVYKLRIYNNSGRLIYWEEIDNNSLSRQYIVWNGRDNSGKLIPDGSYIYYICNSSDNNVLKGRVVKVH